jgi:uncharacterized protein
MSDPGDLSFVAEEFSGRTRLFPLPNLVMFPHVMQPLHIFEPRYRQMVDEAMAGDRLIGMAVLAPGWENDYDGRPPLESVACLARIATCQALADGRFNILVMGLRRIELVRELPPKYLFREAEVRVIEDAYPTEAAAGRPGLQRKLIEAFKKIVPSLTASHEQLDELLASDIALGMLTDIIGYTLELELPFKQQLLAERSVDRRAERLLTHLSGSPIPPARTAFPPDFSAN